MFFVKNIAFKKFKRFNTIFSLCTGNTVSSVAIIRVSGDKSTSLLVKYFKFLEFLK